MMDSRQPWLRRFVHRSPHKSSQALIAGSGIVGFVHHNSAAALVNGLFCAMLLSLAAYTSFYHYRKCAR
jgi:uncharacterized membrane protein (UPF0136 family)